MAGERPARRPNALGGFIESARWEATPGRIAITLTESTLLIEALALGIARADEIAQRRHRKSGEKHLMPAPVVRQILAALIGGLLHGEIFDTPPLRDWRIASGTSPANAKRCIKKPKASDAIDSDEVIRLREQVNAERAGAHVETSLVEKMIG